MICTVNLLPESCRNAQRRALRRNAWFGVGLVAGVLVVGAWIALHASDRAILRFRRELAGLQARQSDLDRRLTLALQRRNRLADRGRALAALQQEEHFPGQLLNLSRLAPDGVVLTEIVARPPGAGWAPAGRGAEAQRGVGPGATARSAGQDPLAVQMRGFAIDHDELERLIEALQQIPHWENVKLLRAAREPYQTGMALAFSLECRPEESEP
jgi:hypothetical protein